MIFLSRCVDVLCAVAFSALTHERVALVGVVFYQTEER